MSGSRDSRLENFLKQASAIIAAEKGLTQQASAKLEELAQRLRLPDELFHQGLAQLQNSGTAKLTSWELGFQDYLKKEFAKLPKGSVLTISMEENAIEIAKNRFEIPRHRAEKLIDQLTRESSFGRLSRQDAFEFGQQMILDRIGGQTGIDEQTLSRITRLGKHWGLKTELVIKITNQRLEFNRQSLAPPSRLPWYIAAIALVALAGTTSWYLWNNWDPFKVASNPSPNPTPPTEIEPADTATVQPSIAAFGDDSPLLSDDPARRAAGVGDAINGVFETRSSSGIDQSLVDFFLAEPDATVANALLASLEKGLDSRVTSFQQIKLRRPYQALQFCDLIAQTKHGTESPLATQRRTQAIELAQSSAALAQSAWTSASLEKANRSIAESQWNSLIEISWSDPSRAATIVDPLATITQQHLPADSLAQLQHLAVRNILDKDIRTWTNLKPSIQKSINIADREQLMQWIDTYESMNARDRDGATFLAPLLVTAWDAWPDALPQQLNKRDLPDYLMEIRNRTIRETLAASMRRDKEINLRARQLNERFESGTLTGAEAVFQVAILANVCLEMREILESGKAGNDAAYSNIDQQLNQMQRRIREIVFLEDNPSRNGHSSSATASLDRRALNTSIESLGNLDEENSPNRLAALNRLSNNASRYDTIDQQQATLLATYLLSRHDPSEWLEIQQTTPKLAKWNRLLLAISDAIPQSDVSIDQALTLTTLLTNNQFELNNSDWREELSLKLFNFASETIAFSAKAVDPVSPLADWLRLEKFLGQAYRNRLRLLAIGQKKPLPEPLPADAASLAGLCLIAKNDRSTTSRPQRTVNAIHDATKNDLLQIVLFNRLLADQQTIAAEEKRPASRQLLLSELELLNQWNRQRKQSLEQLIQRRLLQ